jgi:uncharacterized protein (TIGR02996 family)
MHVTILMRADAPAYTVAATLVERLGFRLMRGIDRRLRVWRTDPDGVGQTVLSVADHRSDDRLWGGYDVALTGDFDDELLAWELVEDLRSLGRPLLLRQETRVLLAWAPALGSRTAQSEVDDPSAWEGYVLPPVTEPVRIAPDDVLGGLYAAILADPDDDGLRLSYADAAAEEHPDYARLIRTQVAYVQDRRAHRDERTVNGSHTYELARDLKDEVLPADVWDLLGDSFQLERGFVETVFVDADAFIELAPRMVVTFPLRMLHLTGVTAKNLPGLSAVPELAHLRGLSLVRNPIGDDGLRTLLTSPYLTRLRWLDLDGTGVTEAGVEALAAAGATPELRYVHAETNLRLNPDPAYEWTGALVYIATAHLAETLGERYDAAWLHRGQQDVRGYADGGPSYDEV